MLRILSRFSVISNIRNPIDRPINNRVKVYDSYIDRYENPLITRFVRKRRVTKEEIHPKIHIIQNTIPGIQRELEYQGLHQFDGQLPLETMAVLYQMLEISSPYILSKFSQKYLKQLLNAYVSKVLVCGRMPPLESLREYRDIEDRVRTLYKSFFFGEEMSRVQQLIEAEYLLSKEEKFKNYNKNFQNLRKRNQYLKCVFNEENQRCLERYSNWQSRPFDDYGDFRPIFQPVLTPTKQESTLLNTIKGTEQVVTDQSTEFISIQLFNRVLDWCGCLEFTRVLKIPTDYLVELSIVNLHIWMIVSRISKQKPQHDLQILQGYLKSNMGELVRSKLGEITVQSNSTFDMDVSQVLQSHWSAYERHFSQSSNGHSNLDGLVFATALLSKTDRHSNTVYLLTEYLWRNYNQICSLSIEDVLKGNVEFDVYLIDPDFKSTFNGSLENYPFKESEKKIVQPIVKPELQLQNKSLSSKIYRLMKIMTEGIKAYDYYSEVSKQEKEQKEQNLTAWTKGDDVEKEFNRVNQIRSNRKK